MYEFCCEPKIQTLQKMRHRIHTNQQTRPRLGVLFTALSHGPLLGGQMETADLAALIEAQIANGRGTAGAVVRAAKVAKAEDVQDYWKSIAPHWGDRPTKGATVPTETGSGQIVDAYEDEYANSIHVEARGDRVRVGSRTKIAVFLEYGTEKTPEHACAARTTEHFNGEVSERTVNRRGQLSRPKPVGRVEA
jgi:hypothetical protein